MTAVVGLSIVRLMAISQKPRYGTLLGGGHWAWLSLLPHSDPPQDEVFWFQIQNMCKY